MHVVGLECPDRAHGHTVRKSVSLERALARQKVWRDRYESVRGELVSDTPHPSREAKDLVNDNYDGSVRAPDGVHHPGSYAVPRTGVNDDPFTVARRLEQTFSRG